MPQRQNVKIKPIAFAIIVIAIITAIVITGKINQPSNTSIASSVKVDSTWKSPDLSLDKSITESERKLILYGADIISNTSKYFGPKGIISASTNGMNCQNCHLDAGTRPWGNNYSAVYSTYPKFRERSGTVESIYKRVSDCFERSLNGRAPDSNSHEFKAIYSYMKWLGKNVNKGIKPYGSGLTKLPFPLTAADPVTGKSEYLQKCTSCHGVRGQGLLNETGTAFIYPPLWGDSSFTNAAGLYRLSNLAAFIKSNMPFNSATHNKPALSDEEAWDIAAFINSQPRPLKDQSKDWRNISKKPVDFPFGPYSDGYSEKQHKYGPWQQIIKKRDSLDHKMGRS